MDAGSWMWLLAPPTGVTWHTEDAIRLCPVGYLPLCARSQSADAGGRSGDSRDERRFATAIAERRFREDLYTIILAGLWLSENEAGRNSTRSSSTFKRPREYPSSVFAALRSEQSRV